MAWTDPRTWADGEVVTASIMNTHVRDNFRAVRRLLGTASYGPGVLTTFTTASASLADVDAVNLAVTFTVPNSGNVIVVLNAVGYSSAGTLHWGLREASSDITGSDSAITTSAQPVRYSHDVVVTGLTPGASKTYKWAYSSGSIDADSGSLSGGPALMQVWSLP